MIKKTIKKLKSFNRIIVPKAKEARKIKKLIVANSGIQAPNKVIATRTVRTLKVITVVIEVYTVNTTSRTLKMIKTMKKCQTSIKL